MSWRARLGDQGYRAPPRPSAQPRVPRPLAPGGRFDGRQQQQQRRPPATVAAAPSRTGAGARSNVVRPVSAPSVRAPAGQMPITPTGRPRAAQPRAPARSQRPPPPPFQRPPPVARARLVSAGGRQARERPRSAATLRAQEPLNTSVAVRTGGRPAGGRRRGPGLARSGGAGAGGPPPARLTAMAVGPQAPPGSPPRPRQVIIPAGAVDETETTVLDVPPGSPLEQPQRILIPPGTVHSDETTVVVVPAPRLLGAPPSPSVHQRYAELAAVAAEREEQERRATEHARAAVEAEAERVRQAKLAFADYLADRTDPQAVRLRQKLLREVDPAYAYEQAHVAPPPPLASRFTAEEARRAEQDLWDADLEQIPDAEDDSSAYRLQMSMNIEHELPPYFRPQAQGAFPPYSPPRVPPSPPAWSPRAVQQRFEQAVDDVGFLSDIEAPDSLFGEEAGWEPPEPAAPLIPPPPPEEEPLQMHWSPPRYYYQRDAPHDPEDLMWEWEEPPRPVYEPPLLPVREPYSAELFRLVRL